MLSLTVGIYIALEQMDADSLDNSRMNLTKKEEVHMKTLPSQRLQTVNNSIRS